MTVKVVLDSNFLLIPAQFSIDIFEQLAIVLNRQYEPVLLSSTVEELKGMVQKGSPKIRKQAEIALKLAQKCRIVNLERSLMETNDDVILRFASQNTCSVATNDRALRRRLRNISVPVIYMRQKSRLELDGSV